MSLTEEKKISKFIYFYSDLYEFYNVHLQERLKGIFDIVRVKLIILKNNIFKHEEQQDPRNFLA